MDGWVGRWSMFSIDSGGWVGGWVDGPINQSVNQSIDQSINQSIDPSIDPRTDPNDRLLARSLSYRPRTRIHTAQSTLISGVRASDNLGQKRPPTSLARYLEESMAADTWEGKMLFNETNYLFGDTYGACACICTIV